MATQEVAVHTGAVGTFNELMLKIETEIEEMKSGVLTEGRAGRVNSARKNQLKLVELAIHAQRLHRNTQAVDLPLLPGNGSSAKATTKKGGKLQ